MSGVAELQAIADRVVSMAQPGEQIEAFVSRDAETDVRIYEGEVEHFVAAQTEGVGIRVIRDGRTGFAYAGVLDESAVAEVLAEARDNVQFGTPDEWAGLAVHTGARVCGMAGAAEILCTRTLHDLAAGSGLIFECLGPQQLKGIPEAVDVYRVTAG